MFTDRRNNFIKNIQPDIATPPETTVIFRQRANVKRFNSPHRARSVKFNKSIFGAGCAALLMLIFSFAIQAQPGELKITSIRENFAAMFSNGQDVTAGGSERFGLSAAGTTVHPAFFNGEISVPNNNYFLQFPNDHIFGYYTYLTDQRYIFHYDMGYEYVTGVCNSAHGVNLYDFTSGHYFYTSPDIFPYLYDYTLKSTLYYYPDPAGPDRYTTNPRYFYNFSTGGIITQ